MMYLLPSTSMGGTTTAIITKLQSSLREFLNDRDPYVSSTKEPHAFASEALSCNRKIALRVIHRDDPIPERESKLSGLIALRIGEKVHEFIQSALVRAFPGCQLEFPWSLGKVTGRADAVYKDPDLGTVVVEIKSMSERSFKKWQKANFPDPGHLTQCALGMLALNASTCHIVYINKAARPNEESLLEWILDKEDLLPDLEMSVLDYAKMEHHRMTMIVDDAVLGEIPAPWYNGDIITDPDSKYWPCGFCHFREECKALGPAPIVLGRPKAA